MLNLFPVFNNSSPDIAKTAKSDKPASRFYLFRYLSDIKWKKVASSAMKI